MSEASCTFYILYAVMNQLSNTSRKLHDRACDLVILFMVYFRFSKMVEITRKISQMEVLLVLCRSHTVPLTLNCAVKFSNKQ